MSSTGLAPSASSIPSDALLHKIGWLCQAVRAMILVLLVWLLVKSAIFWTSDDKIADMARFTLHTDIGHVGVTQKWLGFALTLATVWAINLAIYAAIWRLFSGFLRSEVFTVAAALRMRWAGVFTLAAVPVFPLYRMLEGVIVTAHLPADQHAAPLSFIAGDFSNLLMGAIIIALAQVYKGAAEIADEHAQIL
ncbi:MAG: DUF2975 domain-containing protein [Roseiarcus sp.]|jgi:hypothetical protein